MPKYKSCHLCDSDIPKKHSCSNTDDDEDKLQAWDIYFYLSTLTALNQSQINVLNSKVKNHSDAAAFLLEKCFHWFDGKCDKKHRICPNDLHVSYVQINSNNCPGDIGGGGILEGNHTSIPLPPERCCNTNCSFENISKTVLSQAPGIVPNEILGTPLVSGDTILDIGTSNNFVDCWPIQTGLDFLGEFIDLNSRSLILLDVPGITPREGTTFLRVCFNTKSNCLYIKTPSTFNKYNRFTCTSGKYLGTTKCIYNLGQGGGRCSNTNNNGLPKPGNSQITVLKADNSPLDFNCNDASSYCFWSGSLAGGHGSDTYACSQNCGVPNTRGLWGNAVVTLKDVCPNAIELGYTGNITNRVFCSNAFRDINGELNSGVPEPGLSFPYCYSLLTWKEKKSNGCCDSKKYW